MPVCIQASTEELWELKEVGQFLRDVTQYHQDEGDVVKDLTTLFYIATNFLRHTGSTLLRVNALWHLPCHPSHDCLSAICMISRALMKSVS